MKRNPNNYREKVKPQVWEMVMRHYGTFEVAAEVIGVTRQAVAKTATDQRMPPLWAARFHRDTAGLLDARILCPEVFIGVF